MAKIADKWRVWSGDKAALNRRVDVENYLTNCYAGKHPLPDERTCLKLALRLGTPKKHWPEWVKEKLP